MSDFAGILEGRYGAGEPILSEDALAAFPDQARSTVFGWLKAAVAEGSLARFSRGVYYVPERAEVLGRAVEVPLDPEKVIARKYLVPGGEVSGFVSGLALQNRARVSDQVPAVLEVTTNAETNRSRRIRPFGGYREIVLRRPRVPVTAGNVAALEAIDLVDGADLASLDAAERDALRRKVDAADRATLLECLAAYPKRTVLKLLSYIQEMGTQGVPA